LRAFLAFHSANQSDSGFWRSVSTAGRGLLLRLGTRGVLRTVMRFLKWTECTRDRPQPSEGEVPEAGDGLR
jgi:hypothetical protein